MRNVKGSVTIYLLLSLLLITGLIFTLTEAARIHSIETRLKGLTFLAADSCFAQFSREIFDRYGIMALWKSEAEFTADYDSFLQRNLHLDDLDLYRDADLFLMEHRASALTDVEWLTDDQGNVFLQQVCDYMEYDLVKEGLEEILSMLGVLDEGDKIAAFVERINSYKDVFLQVAEKVVSIQNHVDQARSVIYNPKTILGNMNQSMDRYAQTGNSIYIAQFNTNYWNLADGRDEMLWHMEGIREGAEEFAVSAGNAQEAVARLQAELEESSESYSEETLEAIRGQLETLEQKTADPQGDYYRVEETARAAAGYQEALEGLDPLLYGIDPGQMQSHLLEHQSEVAYYHAAFEDFDLDRLGLDHTSQRVQRESAGFLSTVKDIFTKGLLKAIVGGEISDQKTDTGDFPSVTLPGKRSGGEKESLASVPIRKLLLAEYIRGHFGNFQEPVEDTELCYEMEYILSGKATDKENLESAIRELVLLRSGLNMITLMRDTEKLQEAELLALAIIGFTGIEPLVESLKLLILSVWSLAESLCDAKTLTSGGKIPLIKNAAQWTVSITGLKNFSKTVLPAATEEEGLDYAAYLSLLLLRKSKETLSFRTMDLIQANACRWYEPAFRMDSCVNSISITSVFDARQLFASFLFVRNLAGNGAGDYGFTIEQRYTYNGSDGP